MSAQQDEIERHRQKCLEGALLRGEAWRCLYCHAITGNEHDRCSVCRDGRFGDFHVGNPECREAVEAEARRRWK